MPHLIETALTLWPGRQLRTVRTVEPFGPAFEVTLECGHRLYFKVAPERRELCPDCTAPDPADWR